MKLEDLVGEVDMDRVRALQDQIAKLLEEAPDKADPDDLKKVKERCVIGVLALLGVSIWYAEGAFMTFDDLWFLLETGYNRRLTGKEKEKELVKKMINEVFELSEKGEEKK